ncbi:MAG: type II toxin-antitoxin system VapC family toxin [Nitrospira sp.]|nr:type II toxin-antitoxin system VapC family toxin [Nitrospira sp.]
MTSYVLDASVIVKWFIPETQSESALKLREMDGRFHAPAFVTLEIGNVLAKKRRRNELTHEEAEDIWRAFRQVPIRILSSGQMGDVTDITWASAWENATRSNSPPT